MVPTPIRHHIVNNPFTMTLETAIRNAAFTLKQQADPLIIPDKQIPETILKQAEGFMFITYLRVGFLGGMTGGSGLAVMKKDDGTWGAPSAIGMGGFAFGLVAGADIVNLVLILTHRRLCSLLASKGQVGIGADFGASVGPVGRHASAGLNLGNKGVAPVYSYCQSQGLCFSADISGTVLCARDGVNQRFYGAKHDAQDILMGNVPPPAAAQPLYDALLEVSGGQELDNWRTA